MSVGKGNGFIQRCRGRVAGRDLDAATMMSGELWPTAAPWLLLSFRAGTADPDMSHASEALHFWQYVIEHDLVDVRAMSLPYDVDRIRVSTS